MQILARSPLANLAHCRLGFFLVVFVGLYFPRSRFLPPPIREPFRHIAHFCAISGKFIISRQ